MSNEKMIKDIKDLGKQLEDVLLDVTEKYYTTGACMVDLRALEIAKTEIQTGIMWAEKALTRGEGWEL